MTNFGRELKAQRAACGLSQSQAAARVPFLSVRTLQCWEHGHQSPPVWAQNLILKRIAERRKVAGGGGARRGAKGRAQTDNYKLTLIATHNGANDLKDADILLTMADRKSIMRAVDKFLPENDGDMQP